MSVVPQQVNDKGLTPSPSTSFCDKHKWCSVPRDTWGIIKSDREIGKVGGFSVTPKRLAVGTVAILGTVAVVEGGVWWLGHKKGWWKKSSTQQKGVEVNNANNNNVNNRGDGEVSQHGNNNFFNSSSNIFNNSNNNFNNSNNNFFNNNANRGDEDNLKNVENNNLGDGEGDSNNFLLSSSFTSPLSSSTFTSSSSSFGASSVPSTFPPKGVSSPPYTSSSLPPLPYHLAHHSGPLSTLTSSSSFGASLYSDPTTFPTKDASSFSNQSSSTLTSSSVPSDPSASSLSSSFTSPSSSSSSSSSVTATSTPADAAALAAGGGVGKEKEKVEGKGESGEGESEEEDKNKGSLPLEAEEEYEEYGEEIEIEDGTKTKSEGKGNNNFFNPNDDVNNVNNNLDIGHGGGSIGGAHPPVIVIQPPLLPGQASVTQGSVPPGTPPQQHGDTDNNNLNLGDQQQLIVELAKKVGLVMKDMESCGLKKASQEIYEERMKKAQEEREKAEEEAKKALEERDEVQEEREEVAAKEALKVWIPQAEEELIAKLMDEEKILKRTVLEKSPKLAQDILARNFTQYSDVVREADEMITPPPPPPEAEERWDMWRAYHEIDVTVNWINERVRESVMKSLLGTDWEEKIKRNTSTFSNNSEMVQAVVADRMINRKGATLRVAMEKNVMKMMKDLMSVAVAAMKDAE
jgi:hypothetical protein